MNQSPDPADCRADEALIEIASHKLEEQAAALNQIPQEWQSGKSPGHDKMNNTNLINELQGVGQLDNGVSVLVQFMFR